MGARGSTKVWLQYFRPSKVVTIAAWILAGAMLVLLTVPIGFGRVFEIAPTAISSDGGYAYIQQFPRPTSGSL